MPVFGHWALLQTSFTSRHVASMCFLSTELTTELNNVSISVAECTQQRMPRTLPACYWLITGEDDMCCCSLLGIVSLPCPSVDRKASLCHCSRDGKNPGGRGDGRGGNESQSDPNPPKMKLTGFAGVIAPSTVFFWQEIQLSTNRGFNKC